MVCNDLKEILTATCISLTASKTHRKRGVKMNHYPSSGSFFFILPNELN